jgi:hypothetical protein
MIKCFRSKVVLCLIAGVPLTTLGLAQVVTAASFLPGATGGEAQFLDRAGNTIVSQLDMNDTIMMQDNDGNPVQYAAGPAYSPKATCGKCHDYTAINKAYHFMQGALPGTAISEDRDVDTSGMGVSDTWSSENQSGTSYKYLANAYGHLLSGGQFGAW